jgi:multicomponent Na+:H+ antiporter subunit D
MTDGAPWIAWVVLIPLAGAMLAVLASPRVRVLAGLTALATVAATVALIAQVAAHGPVTHVIGGWPVPLGITLRADGLAALLLAANAGVGGLAVAYAAATGRATPHRFFALWLLGWASLNALAVSADAFNLYVTLELLTLVAVALIALSRERATLAAALRYVLLALVGSLLYLLGIVLLYAAHPVLELGALGAALEPGPTVVIAIAVMTVGLALKTALFPLHGWLPVAYAGAPPACAVVLAGLIGKASFYVLLRLWFEVFPVALSAGAGVVLGVLGSAGALWGAALALRQSRLSRLLAYSSVGQVGYLFLVFPLATHGAVAGGMYLVISHATAKAALFMAVGTIVRVVGSDELTALGRIAPRLPITMFTIALAGLTLMGLPPSGGFVAKWLLLRASLETGQWWWSIALIGGGLLAAGYVFRVVRLAFAPHGADSADAARLVARPQRVAELVALVLALGSVALGVIAAGPLALLEVGEAGR